MMKKELVAKILEEWTSGLSGERALARIFEKVRDIPWGVIGSRDPEQVYLKNMGTCSGKHFLFFELAVALGFEARHFVCSHSFRQSKMHFPPNLKKMLDEGDIVDYHNFVEVLVGGRWLTVDVTWDLPMKEHGFPVQESLNGRRLSSVPIETSWEAAGKDPEKFKEEKIASMPKPEQGRRKLFLKGLSDWVAGLRQ